MRKQIFLFFILLAFVWTQLHSDFPPEKTKETKVILAQVAQSLVKVVAENGRIYFATGIAMEPEFILTTSLIDSHAYEKLYVETIKNETSTARIVGRDPFSGIILLRLENRRLPPIRMASDIDIGERVLLVGAFYNQFPSIFNGIVSSISDDALIVNAPVAPGAAGGAIINEKGELIGIIRGRIGFSFYPNYTFKDSSSEIHVTGTRDEANELCYAVPSRKIKNLFSQLKKFGKVSRPWLGLSLAEESNIVTHVTANSPAQKAGVKIGDHILGINGKKVITVSDISAAIQNYEPGSRITIKAIRSGNSIDISMEIGERPQASDSLAENSFTDDFLGERPAKSDRIPMPSLPSITFSFSGTPILGIDVFEMTQELAEKYKIREGGGLLIARIWKDSPSEKCGLRAGDVLIRAGERKTMQFADLREALQNLRDEESLALEVYRDGLPKKFLVKPEPRKDYSGEMTSFMDQMERMNEMWRMEAERKTLQNTSQQEIARSDAEQRILKEKMHRTQEIQKTIQEKRQEMQYSKVKEEMKKVAEENKKTIENMRKQYEEMIKKMQEEINQLKKSRSKSNGS